ncbi:MAG: MarR family transcriptional regulator [Nakamurella sp.]
MPTGNARIVALDKLLEIVVVLTDDMTKALAALNLTPARAALVWRLEHGGPCTGQRLADDLEVSPRNITGLVDGLVTTGFVSREPHPTDRRASLVTLTDHGHQVAQSLQREQVELAEYLFGDLPAARLEQLVTGFGELLDRIRAQLTKSGSDDG